MPSRCDPRNPISGVELKRTKNEEWKRRSKTEPEIKRFPIEIG
ncbi:hypothetical protein LEP1GSC052_3829 [Leptospira kmetyi serovar Malaysia str. Bejo-Iso9]|nr:hypothetical protein LEP1GSC052_3829 [Leptospira kmetyi serovar Malaysia str. Bejo-Iso9]